MKSGRFSVRSRLESFRFAFEGLSALFRTEHNSRIHLIAAILAILAGIIFRIDTVEWCVIILAIGLVFITELINSSIELLCDVAESKWNEKIKASKDMAAAAVLIAAIISVAAGIIIFLPRLINLIRID